MKKLLIICLGLVLSIGASNAQEVPVKLGHINSQEILMAMPGRVAAEKEMEALKTKLEASLMDMSKTYEAKVGEYQSLAADTPPSTIEALKNEIIGLESRIQNYQISAEQDLAKKQEDLLQPMLQDVQKAIDEVGAENGFAYIFDISTGTILYKAGEDVSVLVKKKLGIM